MIADLSDWHRAGVKISVRFLRFAFTSSREKDASLLNVMELIKGAVSQITAKLSVLSMNKNFRIFS